MNKSILLAPMLLSLAASAQPVSGNAAHKVIKPALHQLHQRSVASRNNPVFALLAKQETGKRHNAARTTATTTERLVATSDYDYSPADSSYYHPGLVDSMRLKYSGQNGSTFNQDILDFIAPDAEYFFAGSSLNNYDGYIHRTLSALSPVTILSDTALFWNSDLLTDATGHGQYSYAEEMYDVYDANKNVTFHSQQMGVLDTSGQWDHVMNTFDANNNITTSVDMNWTGTSFDTGVMSFYYYNTSNKLVSDSFALWGGGTWMPLSKDSYTYAAGGNMTNATTYQFDGMAWTENTRYVIAYNSDNTLNNDSVSQYNGTTWDLVLSENFGYTPGSDFWTSLTFNQFSPGSFDRVVLNKHIAATGLVDTFKIKEYSSDGVAPSYLVSATNNIYTYDSYHNPLIVNGYWFTISDSASGTGSYSAAPTTIKNYYYETYSSTEAVQQVAQVAEHVNIYPNPTANEINIARPDATAGTYTLLTLTNATGQTVRTESLPWMSAMQTFSLAGVAPGVYLITIKDKAGNTVHVGKVVKE